MVTTVTDNSPQAINTSLFSLEKDTDEKAKLLNEKLNEVNSAIAEINKILDGINKDAGVVSVNGKQGIVVLDASDIGGLATVATSGSYNDLSNKPSIPAAQVPSDWNATSGVARILNKPNLASVATSGSYSDLSNKPTIPAAQVNSDWNATGGVAQILNKPSLATVATSGSYSDLSNKPTIPTKTSELTNDSGFVTSSSLSGKVNKSGDTMTGNLYFHGTNAMVIGFGKPPRDFVDMDDSAYNTLVDGAYMAFGDDETGGIIAGGDGIDMWAPPDNDLVRFWNEDSSTPVASIDDSGWLKGKAYCSKRGIVSTFSNWTVFNNFINSESPNLTLDEDEVVPGIEGGSSGGYVGSSTKAFVRGNGSPAPNTTYSMWFVETTLALNDDDDGHYGVQVAYGLTSSPSTRSTFRRFLIDGAWTAWGSNDI